MKALIAAALIAAAPYHPVVESSNSDAAYYNRVDDADKAISRGDWGAASKAINEALMLQPHNNINVMLLSNLGIIELNMGHDSLALKALNDAHKLAPRSVTVLQNRARAFTAIGDMEAACKDYSRVVELDSTVTTARFYRAIINLRKGNMPEAKADVDYLSSHVPELTETSIASGAFAMATGDYDGAIIAYTAVLKDEAQPEYYGERALAYLKTGRLPEASADIAEGLRLDPEDPMLYLYRAIYNKKCYLYDESKADIARAIELGIDQRRAKEIVGE